LPDPRLQVVEPDLGGSRSETTTRRRSPATFLHAAVFVLGGGLAVIWTRWGLLLVGVGAVVGLLLLKVKASTLDMNEERRRVDQLRDDVAWLRETAEHPDGSAHERLRTLEVLHRYGRLSADDYEAKRREIVRRTADRPRPADGSDKAV
jgi:hypothetical protein